MPLFLPLRGQGARASMAACFSKNLTAKSKFAHAFLSSRPTAHFFESRVYSVTIAARPVGVDASSSVSTLLRFSFAARSAAFLRLMASARFFSSALRFSSAASLRAIRASRSSAFLRRLAARRSSSSSCRATASSSISITDRRRFGDAGDAAVRSTTESSSSSDDLSHRSTTSLSSSMSIGCDSVAMLLPWRCEYLSRVSVWLAA